MKKTLCFVLGAMFTFMLSGRGVEAQQTIPVDLSVMTMDRATLTSARVYMGTTGVDYFVDSASLSDSYTGNAVWIDTLTYTELSIENGYDVMGFVDSTYNVCFVLIKDNNNRYYVLGAGSDYNLGVFQATTLALSGSINNLGAPINVEFMLGENNAVIQDNTNWFYSSFQNAAYWASFADGINALTFVNNVTLSGSTSVTIDNSLTINQNGKTITNQLAVPAVIINNSDVSWEGSISNIAAGAGTGRIFMLNNSSLMMQNVTIASGSVIAQLENNSFLSADVCDLSTSNDSAAIIIVKDGSRAEVGNVNFSGPVGSKAVTLATGSTGTLDILGSTVENRLNGLPILAYGRVERSNGHYLYSRDLNIATDSANGDTVYLNMDYTGTTPQTVATAAVLQLGDKSLSSLYVGHTADTMVILGGNVNSITGISGNAPMTLSVDSLGELTVANHPTTIVGGRYVSLANASGDPISIEGGKYATRYDNYVANRHFFIENTDAADSALFPWTIGTGYKVTWKHWDYVNNFDTIYNNSDNKINPVKSIPARFIGTDTTFIAWWVDSLFSDHPWDFDNEVLTSDTTLYAEWHIVDSTETYYTARHVRIGIDAQDSIVDTLRRYATIGSPVSIQPLAYSYYTPVEAGALFTMPDHDTVVTIHYVRDTFHLVWNLNGGHFTDNSPLDEYLAWGQPIDYTRVPVRRGYTFAGWQPAYTTMPTANTTINARWSRNVYTVNWEIQSSNVTYTAEPVTGIVATYTHEEGTDTAILSYINIATGITASEAINVGNYVVIASAQSEDFYLDTNTTFLYLNIYKAGLTASGWEVEHEKFYDGTNAAVITTYATLEGVLGDDEVVLDMENVNAQFSDATVGEGKPIIVNYNITGADVSNYYLDTTTAIIAYDGAIIENYVMMDTAANGIEVNAFGYCSGNDTIRYFLTSGNPDEYKLIFSDEALAQNFVDVDWTALDATNAGTIVLNIPADANFGLYTVKLLFRNSAHPNLVSDTITIGFNVNLPKTYTMPLFNDVIALVDTCHCFTDIHWLHSTDGGATWTEITEAAGQYYYQEVGGLTGEYRVMAKMNGVATTSCPQDDVTTLIADEAAPTTVGVYPNPTADRANITITNSRNATHSLRVMSIMGVEMVNTTFNGDTYQLELGNLANGSYTVSVDGIVVRVIKK